MTRKLLISFLRSWGEENFVERRTIHVVCDSPFDVGGESIWFANMTIPGKENNIMIRHNNSIRIDWEVSSWKWSWLLQSVWLPRMQEEDFSFLILNSFINVNYSFSKHFSGKLWSFESKQTKLSLLLLLGYVCCKFLTFQLHTWMFNDMWQLY